jgi:hypothetical protein
MEATENTESLTAEEAKIGQFLVARGGPFYTLQRQLGLLREDAFRAGRRAVLLVGLAWGVPLILSIVAGDAIGPYADRPYLLDPGAWARFFIAVGLFILMERQVEERLRKHLAQFARAPLLAPGSFEPAAEAVTKALKWRDSRIAEIVCLIIAILATISAAFRMIDVEISSWMVRVSPDGNSLTMAGWWCMAISNTLFLFLLLRWLWRLFVWSMLLRDLAGLELRLVATHPDGYGGLAFIGQYPNAYATFILAVSCVVGAAIAKAFLAGDLTGEAYGIVMGVWLVIVFLPFSVALLAFRKPLAKLKEQTSLACSSLATQHHRAAERDLLGKNISASEDAEKAAGEEVPDPSKAFATTRKLSVFPFSRSALLPIATAALLPLVAAGATIMPIKELLKILKRLLLL